MTNSNEYTIARHKDEYDDDVHTIMRETVQSSGIVVVKDIAKISFGAIPPAVFPSGLIRPTNEQTERIAGKNAYEVQTEHSGTYKSRVDMTHIKKSITGIVLEGVTTDRAPAFEWKEGASEDELAAFQEAINDVNTQLNGQKVEPEEDIKLGMYL